jgi:hypothetical protein
MEKFVLDKDLSILYITASLFPDGIQDAFDSLRKIVPDEKNRSYFGIVSQDSAGKMMYKAGALTTFDGEEKKYNLGIFTIKKGNYITETIYDWKRNIPLIKTVFATLFGAADVQRDSPCLEWYKNDDELMCMVKVKDAER